MRSVLYPLIAPRGRHAFGAGGHLRFPEIGVSAAPKSQRRYMTRSAWHLSGHDREIVRGDLVSPIPIEHAAHGRRFLHARPDFAALRMRRDHHVLEERTVVRGVE